MFVKYKKFHFQRIPWNYDSKLFDNHVLIHLGHIVVTAVSYMSRITSVDENQCIAEGSIE